jgi:hypothetical protein
MKDQLQGVNMQAVDQKIKDLEEAFSSQFEKVLDSRLATMFNSLEELKKEFAVALNEAEDTSFKMNEKMIESIVVKMKSLEKELTTSVQELRAGLMKSNGPSSKSTTHEAEYPHLVAEIELIKKELEGFMHRNEASQILEDAKRLIEENVDSLSSSLRELRNRIDTKLDANRDPSTTGDQKLTSLESKIEKVEEKLSILERIKRSGMKETQKNPALSSFLSPDELMYSNRSNTGNINDGKNRVGGDKKRIPNINLQGIGVGEVQQVKSKDPCPSRNNIDDSYTSFEEEFRFRLGTKTSLGRVDEIHRTEDIKLSYVFSSPSKENIGGNVDGGTGGLSRRLFDEDNKLFTETDSNKDTHKYIEKFNSLSKLHDTSKAEDKHPTRKPTAGPITTTLTPTGIVNFGKKEVSIEDYTAILNNVAHLPGSSFARHIVMSGEGGGGGKVEKGEKGKGQAGMAGQGVVVGQNGLKGQIRSSDKSSTKKKVIPEDYHMHNKENIANRSNHFRPLGQLDEVFDFEKWAKDNELQISGFNFN